MTERKEMSRSYFTLKYKEIIFFLKKKKKKKVLVISIFCIVELFLWQLCILSPQVTVLLSFLIL